ncbi:MAG: hypothetical protein RLY57_495 [Candidatus Parcubacteria bacterium]|jgi:hypothetical protein
MESLNQETPSFNPELGQQYIYNAARAAAERGDKLWQIDDKEKVVAAASTREVEDAVIVENIGSLVRGKGKELLLQIATYAISVNKQLLVSATFDSEGYYQKLGFAPLHGRNGMWAIDPKLL